MSNATPLSHVSHRLPPLTRPPPSPLHSLSPTTAIPEVVIEMITGRTQDDDFGTNRCVDGLRCYACTDELRRRSLMEPQHPCSSPCLRYRRMNAIFRTQSFADHEAILRLQHYSENEPRHASTHASTQMTAHTYAQIVMHVHTYMHTYIHIQSVLLCFLLVDVLAPCVCARVCVCVCVC